MTGTASRKEGVRSGDVDLEVVTGRAAGQESLVYDRVGQ